MKDENIKKLEELRILTKEFNETQDKTLSILEEGYKITKNPTLAYLIDEWLKAIKDRLKTAKAMQKVMELLKPNQN